MHNRARLSILALAFAVVACGAYASGYVLRGEKTVTVQADDDPRFNTDAALDEVCHLYKTLYGGKVGTSTDQTDVLLGMVEQARYTQLEDSVHELVLVTLDPASELDTEQGVAWIAAVTQLYEEHIRDTCEKRETL